MGSYQDFHSHVMKAGSHRRYAEYNAWAGLRSGNRSQRSTGSEIGAVIGLLSHGSRGTVRPTSPVPDFRSMGVRTVCSWQPANLSIFDYKPVTALKESHFLKIINFRASFPGGVYIAAPYSHVLFGPPPGDPQKGRVGRLDFFFCAAYLHRRGHLFWTATATQGPSNRTRVLRFRDPPKCYRAKP